MHSGKSASDSATAMVLLGSVPRWSTRLRKVWTGKP